MSIPDRRLRSRSGVPLRDHSRQSSFYSERRSTFNLGAGAGSARPVVNRTYSNRTATSASSSNFSQATASTVGPSGLASVAESEDALKKGELKEGRKANVEQGNYGAAYYKTMTIAQLKLQNPYLDIINQNIILAEQLKNGDKSGDPLSKHLAKLNKHNSMADLTNYDTDFERWLTLTFAAHMRHAYEIVAKSEMDPSACAVFVFVQYKAPELGSDYLSRVVLSGKNVNVRTDAAPTIRNGFCSGLSDDEVKTRFTIRGSKVIGDEDVHIFLQKVGKEEDEAMKLMDTMVQERINTAKKGKTAGFLYLVMMVNGDFRTELTQFILPGVKELPKIKEALEEKSAAIDAKQQKEKIKVEKETIEKMFHMGRLRIADARKRKEELYKSCTTTAAAAAAPGKDGPAKDAPSPTNSGLGQDGQTEYDADEESMADDSMIPAEEFESVNYGYTSSEGSGSEYEGDDDDQESKIVRAHTTGTFGRHIPADESIVIQRSDNEDEEGSVSGASSITGQCERSNSDRDDEYYAHNGSEGAPFDAARQEDTGGISYNAYGNFQHALSRRAAAAALEDNNNNNSPRAQVIRNHHVQYPVHPGYRRNYDNDGTSYNDFQAYRNMEMMAAATAAAEEAAKKSYEQPQQYDYHRYARPSKQSESFW